MACYYYRKGRRMITWEAELVITDTDDGRQVSIVSVSFIEPNEPKDD